MPTIHPSSYPDAPSRRMAYHDDGTVVVGTKSSTAWLPSGGVAPPVTYIDHSLVDKQAANSEDPLSMVVAAGAANSGTIVWCPIFPELRELDGYFWYQFDQSEDLEWIYYSLDTTDGRNGTWSPLGSQVSFDDGATPIAERYRNNIQATAISNVRAVALLQAAGGGGSGSRLRQFHLYGEIAAGETPDRLLWIDDSDDLEFTLPLDYGDIPRGSAEEYALYLTNNSGSLTANSVQLTTENLHRNMATWMTISEGGSFQSTLPLGASIGPGANSPTLTLRRVTPDPATVGLYAAWLSATVGSWT